MRGHLLGSIEVEVVGSTHCNEVLAGMPCDVQRLLRELDGVGVDLVVLLRLLLPHQLHLVRQRGALRFLLLESTRSRGSSEGEKRGEEGRREREVGYLDASIQTSFLPFLS